MFTGIIQEKGKVVNFSKGILEISTNLDLSDCKIGSSICCNGVCLTATEIQLINNLYHFKTNVGEETMWHLPAKPQPRWWRVPVNNSRKIRPKDRKLRKH